MRVRRTPRELKKEIDGAIFTFRRADLREIGEYFSARPNSLQKLFEEAREKKENGDEMPDAEFRDRALEVHNQNPGWYQYRIDFVLSKLTRVDGLSYEDGTPLEMDAISWDVPPHVITELVNWYEVEMVSALPSTVTDEKKTTPGEGVEATQEHSVSA